MCKILTFSIIVLLLTVCQSLTADAQGRFSRRAKPIVRTTTTRATARPVVSSASTRRVDGLATKIKQPNVGRQGKQARLRQLANDPKTTSADRAWIKQEQNAIQRGNRKTIRVPPGKQLAHPRGREAAKGYDYREAKLQTGELHRLQHQHDKNGKLQKHRSVANPAS